jgi:hypothetical protein
MSCSKRQKETQQLMSDWTCNGSKEKWLEAKITALFVF